MDNPPPPPAPSTQQTPTQQTPHTVSTIKLPILKKGEYDICARERERKARTTLLMAIPEDHLAKFHKMTDAKDMWNAIKSRFGGNDESKKMQKYILKQQFEGFSVSNSDGIHKGYERFQRLLSQLEIHGAGVSTEDANQKFLRSLPSAWLQVSLIMRNKPGMDSLSFDDLYNNLRVFENDVKGSTASSSNLQNIAFVSENTNSTNEVSTDYGVSNTSGHCSKHEQTSTSSYSLLASQSSCPQLDHEDLDQVDEYDLEEMDLKWQVAMISMRIKKFQKKTGRKLQFDAKEPVGFDKTKVECYNCHKTGHFARECRTKEENRRRDGWNTGNREGRRTGNREESTLVTQVMEKSDASIEIKAYTQGLKKVEAQLVAHQQGQLWYEQKIKFMKIDLDDKTYVLTYHKKLLAEAMKEKEDLKAKVEKWHNSSKNLGKLINTQMSANDKFGLGYGDHRYDGILSYENEVLQSVFKGKESDFKNPPLYDRFVTAGGMNAVPPPMTGNYMPSGPDIEIDYSQFTYGPKQTQPSESETQTSEFDTCESNISTETPELVSEPVVNESNVACQPKVWSDAPIIEEYESDSEDEYVSIPTKEQETPSFANQQVKTPKETVKNHFTHSKNPKVDKKELGYGFTARACFVCGSLNHLIRDCDFHKKRMAKQAELNNRLKRNSSQREIRPIWNNVQRVNNQNQFVPIAVLTKTGKILVNTTRASGTKNVSTARHSFIRQALVLLGEKGKLLLSPQQVGNGEPQRQNSTSLQIAVDYPHRALQNKGIVDSGCSRHMTGNKAYLAEYQDFNGGPVAFGGSKSYLMQIKSYLESPDKTICTFQLYENIVPSGGLACLIAKATIDESNKWHNRLGHVNFKNLYKLVKGNLVRGLPSNIFQNDHTCVACQKGKQHKASCKAKSVSSISHSLQLLHMNLFTYCLVIADDFSRFSWVFFLRTKDETSGILKDFIRQIENQLNQKVKTIRCDNGTKFKNKDVIELCGSKWIKMEYSNARTPQQIGVAKRKNRTLIEAARIMLADSFLPNTFWAEAVILACYVFNRVLVTKPHNKTPYELITGKIPIISYIRPFGCHVTILNTIDHLGKFDGKSDEGFLVGYSLQSKAFRVYNLENKRVEENLHITFLENKPNVAGKGPTWLFDLDYLTDSMNYQPVRSENRANKHAGPPEANQNAGTEDSIDAGDSEKEDESAQDYFVLPIWSSYSSTIKRSRAEDAGAAPHKHPDLKTDEKPVDKEDQVFLDELERLKRQEKDANDAAEALRKEFAQETENLLIQVGAAKASSTNIVNTVSTPVSTASPYDPTNPEQDDSEIPALEDIYQNPTDVFYYSPYDRRIHSIHPSTLILGDPKSAVQTRSKVTKSSGAHAFVSYVQKQRRNNHKDFQHCLFACFLSQNETLEDVRSDCEDESWVDAMQEELLQFKIQKVWILVDLPYGKKAIGTKWVYRNKKDERGVVVRNKARLVAQGHRQEEGIDYDEVFAPVARIEAHRTFYLQPRTKVFIVYQMDVKSAFLYGKIDEEVYVSQPPGFLDPKYPQKVYKVVKALYGLHQAPRAWYATLSTFLLKNGYIRGTIDKTLFLKKDKHDIIYDKFMWMISSLVLQRNLVKQKADGIFISQDKYVAEILKKFDFVNVKTASTPIETQKPLVKDEDIDWMFQVTPKTSHLSVVKRIFRYLKGKPKLGLWYPRVSSIDLEAYSDSDYAGANLDRKSTTGEAEYVAAASCCGQVLWIQNQMLDYGFNFMNTKIYIDNESTICIVKNPVYYSKTKNIAIRHHFIRDAYEKKLI
ncbi:putative ribonuclease H-like domain-containing protein [Tanacetum coccineum]